MNPDCFKVVSVAPSLIQIEIVNIDEFKKDDQVFALGTFLQLKDDKGVSVIAIVKSYRIKDPVRQPLDDDETMAEPKDPSFVVDAHPLGFMDADGKFERGGQQLAIPPSEVQIAEPEILAAIYADVKEAKRFSFGRLSANQKIEFYVDGDSFFSKHIAVVGSTGSGKSCAVARVLQDVVGIKDGTNGRHQEQNNSHIVIFDIHDEYKAAFTLGGEQPFTLNALGVDSLAIPYWLMNSEELESMFIESNESNSHNQVSLFKQAVILNKERHNPGIGEVTYDMPVYFSMKEVLYYIENMNREIVSRLEGENVPKLADGTLVHTREKEYFKKFHDFVPQSQATATKATNGPFNGEFNRFVSRLETRLADKRLRFLLSPAKENGEPYETGDFAVIMKQFVGYINKSNVTIIDLSGIPFEVLSITVSLISRLIFDFCFHYSKLRHDTKDLNDVPVMIVCEEAHNYVPQSDIVAYRASRKSIERIAKEGRKYGLSLMIVSQRPSEVSETIFAQCNNFIALRLTNSADQNYVRRLFPDNSSAITETLPNLGPGECIVVGDAVTLPAIVQMPLPNPEPHSQSVNVHTEWKGLWRDVIFDDVISRWRKE